MFRKLLSAAFGRRTKEKECLATNGNVFVAGGSGRPFAKTGVFRGKCPDGGIILSGDTFLSKDHTETGRAANVLVTGSCGSGKTRHVIGPNLLQMHGSYVVIDTGGILHKQYGRFFSENGYKVRVLDLDRMKGCRYNPFRYIRSDEDIEDIVDVLISSTAPPERNDDVFPWEEAERSLLVAMVSYVHTHAAEKDRSFLYLTHLLRTQMAPGPDGTGKEDLPLDGIFKEAEESGSGGRAVSSYRKFKKMAGERAGDVLASCLVMLQPFDLFNVADMTATDTGDLCLETVGDKKTALFITVSGGFSSFLAAMAVTQMLGMAVRRCSAGEDLRENVMFILDEFANIGKIPGLGEKMEKLIGTGVSFMIVLQSIEQIEQRYGRPAYAGGKAEYEWKKIVRACGSKLLLSGRTDHATEEWFIMECRKTAGRQPLSSNAVTEGVIREMEDDRCIVLINRFAPIIDAKYRLETHPLAGMIDGI